MTSFEYTQNSLGEQHFVMFLKFCFFYKKRKTSLLMHPIKTSLKYANKLRNCRKTQKKKTVNKY